MDVDDTPDEAAFRAEARAWLSANASPKGAADDWSDGFFDVTMDDDELMAKNRAWQRLMWDEGWAGISYPKDWYGRGGSVVQELIFAQEMAGFGVSNGAFVVAHTMVGPAILAHGTDEQRHRYLPAMLRGDEMWCQLFSEPGAGSDLAGLSTRALRDGDHWVVNGQKVWTSNAETSQWGILLARTEPDAPKHRGITYFLVDMATPGIEVRPLRQMTGESHFSEVFLTDVVIPTANVLGGEVAVNHGWSAAIHTLANERAMIGGGGHMADVPGLIELARLRGQAADPTVRQELAAAHSRSEVLRFLGYRLADRTGPGPSARARDLDHEAVHGRSPRRDGVARQAAPGRRRNAVGRPGRDPAHGRCRTSTGRPGSPELAIPVRPVDRHRRRHEPGPAQHHRRASPRASPGAEVGSAAS